MSIRAMQAVWDHSAQQGSRLLLMLALADYADDEGMSWPKLATLAQKCRCSRGYIKTMIGDLKEAGEVQVIERHVEGGGNMSNLYKLTVLGVTAVSPGVTPVPPPGATPVTPPGHPGAPLGVTLEATEPSVEPPIEPPEIKNTAPRAERKRPPHDDVLPQTNTPQRAMFAALAEAWQVDVALAPKGRVGKVASAMVKAGYTPEQVQAGYRVGGWWYTHDWRGKGGAPATPEQVAETIRQATNGNGKHYDIPTPVAPDMVIRR
jgi:hypothetical protein